MGQVRTWRPAAAVLLVLLVGCGDQPHDEEVVWHLTSEPQRSMLEVSAVFGGSSCTDFEGWRVDESSTVVEVRAIVTFSGDEVCTADLDSEPHTIRLDEPLGNRRLAGCDPDDPAAACDDVVPVSASGDAGSRP
jgi:hypothetical protein